MVRPTLVALAKRVPLIHFRKGGAGVPGAQTANQKASSQASGGKKLAGGPAIEDYELPARFARKPIDAEEAAYINNGGIPK
ncbi:GD11171 [Drosophila simulans]|uniref:GD11171 n=1 Tax=Drosophila simulans TaxID=7240 RepID=B4QHH1_DROSI|nr:GD11171 [Drosophila simulans]